MTVKTDHAIRHGKGARAKPSNVTRIRALVIGEEPATDHHIREAFCGADIEVTTPVQREEAEVLLHGQKFDVIVIDVSPRSGDGAELVEKIRYSGFNRNTPIIMISADQRPAALSEAFAAGANFFVYKPVDKLHLISLVRVTQGVIDSEKRRFRRVALQTKVRLRRGDRDVEGMTIDVSLNGALVDAARTFPLGSVVEVSLHTAAGMKPVVGVASVVRLVGDNQMGIQFERLPVEESGRLQDFLLLIIGE